MTRWIGSLLIAAVSSVVTLLLAWSSLGPPVAKNANADQDGSASREMASPTTDESTALTGDTTAEMLKQLALLEVPEQGGQADRARLNPDDRVRLGMPDRGHRGPLDGVPMSPRARIDFCERCNEVAYDIDPSLARRLQALREQDPAEFERNMKLFGRKLFAMAELKQRDPELYSAKLNELRMELSVRQMAHDLREARAAGNRALAEAYESPLRSALGIQLAMSIKARLELVCRLEEQVKQIRAEIEDQASRYNESIEQRFQSLLQNPPPVLGGANSTTPVQPEVSATAGKN